MKKIKWIILGLGILVSFNLGSNNVVNAADNETATETTESNSVPSDVKNAVDNLLDNYTNDNITVTDASFSRPTLDATDGTYSFNEFSKIPVMKNFIFKNGSNSLAPQLNNVQFRYYGHYPISGLIDFTYWVQIFATYNGQEVGSKTIKVNNGQFRNQYTDATKQTGVVEATHAEGSNYAPLLDTENEHSSRSLAPNSYWFTDRFMVDMEWATLYYRVSTSEWVNEYYAKPHANPSLQISDPISVGRSTIYRTSYRAISGDPVYKSDGQLWNFTLPNNSEWKITAIAFDQYGVAYGQVSTGAWVRLAHI